jgi:hypothetical protein
MRLDFEWITGFAIGLDYLEEIEVEGADYELSIIRIQLGFFAIYIPLNQ